MKFRHVFVLTMVAVMSLFFSGCSKNESEVTTEASNVAIDVEAVAQDFVDDFVNRNFDVLLTNYSYSDDMKALFTKETMEEVSGQIEKSYGESTRISGVKVQERPDFVIVSIGVDFPDAALAYNIVFSHEGLLSGFNYNEIASIDSFFGVALDGSVETAVSFGDENFLIEGTLSIPDMGQAKYPVAILVHGSGPHDRDQSIYGNKPFRDIAEGLLQKGVAVLRYDKRTMTHNQQFLDPAVTKNLTIYDEVIDDVLYAVDFLKHHEAIDASNIYIVGHSLGGNQAPRIAEKSDDVAGIAILAGNVSPIQDMILIQYEYLLGIDGSYSDKDNAQLDAIRKAVDLINSDKFTMETDPNDVLGLTPMYMMDLKDYNPVEIAKKLDRPILIMQGGRDYQVTVSEFEKWKTGLGSLAEFRLYDDLNHLFISGVGPSVPAEYTKAGKVSEKVIEDLAEWLLSNLK